MCPAISDTRIAPSPAQPAARRWRGIAIAVVCALVVWFGALGHGALAQLNDGSSADLIKALHPELGESLNDWSVGEHTSTEHGVVVADWGGDVGPALRFLLKEGDPEWKGSKGYRAELHMVDHASPGTRRLYEREIYLPNGWDQGTLPTWNDRILHQWHGDASAPSGSSPVFGLRHFDGSRLAIGRKNTSGKSETLGYIDVTLDVWLTERVEIYWTTETDGYFDISLGDQHFRYDGPTLLGDYAVYEKVGIYHQPTLYYERNHQISEGVAGPEPAATPTATPTPTPTATPTPPTVVFTEGFESAIWTQGTRGPWFISSERSLEGEFAAQFDGHSWEAAMTSPAIDLQGRRNVSIVFWWFIEEQLDAGEYLAFQISTDHGVTWVERARLAGNQDPEQRWLQANIEVTDIDSLQLRFVGKMSQPKEDAHVDAISVVGH